MWAPALGDRAAIATRSDSGPCSIAPTTPATFALRQSKDIWNLRPSSPGECWSDCESKLFPGSARKSELVLKASTRACCGRLHCILFQN